MADIINLQAEDNRNIIDDDAVPTLTLQNTNATANGGGIALKATSSADHALDVYGSANATIAPIRAVNSVASGAIFEIGGALISTASLTVHAGAIPVRLEGEDKIVYLVGYEIV